MGAIGRAFVAVVPSDDVLDALEARIGAGRECEPGLKWVRREQLHVTLQFLGRVGDVDVLGDAVRSQIATLSPFTARLGGAGAFPKPRRAAVVWTGVTDGEPQMIELARAVSEATATVGFETEDRPFHPHVTLARVPRPRPVEDVLAALGGDPVGPSFEVSGVVLFESQTRREGAVYTEVARFPLSVR
jgi:2'-5' RNA ligase